LPDLVNGDLGFTVALPSQNMQMSTAYRACDLLK
jgi:hypothetical protein